MSLNSTATNTTIKRHRYTSTPAPSQQQKGEQKTEGWIVKKQEEKVPKKKTKFKETLTHLQKQNKNTKEKGVNSRFRAGNVIQSG